MLYSFVMPQKKELVMEKTDNPTTTHRIQSVRTTQLVSLLEVLKANVVECAAIHEMLSQGSMGSLLGILAGSDDSEKKQLVEHVRDVALIRNCRDRAIDDMEIVSTLVTRSLEALCRVSPGETAAVPGVGLILEHLLVTAAAVATQSDMQDVADEIEQLAKNLLDHPKAGEPHPLMKEDDADEDEKDIEAALNDILNQAFGAMKSDTDDAKATGEESETDNPANFDISDLTPPVKE